MSIESIGNAAFNFKEVQLQKQTSLTGAQDFLGRFKEVALPTQLVVRGEHLSSAGMHERKMVDDWLKPNEEKEDTLEDILGKIMRIDEILKEKFSG